MTVSDGEGAENYDRHGGYVMVPRHICAGLLIRIVVPMSYILSRFAFLCTFAAV